MYYDHLGQDSFRGDGEHGHGTHVAGSVAGGGSGSPFGNDSALMTQYSGMAPEAKIAMWGRHDPIKKEFNIPSAYTAAFYQQAYNMGIRISSNSWACASEAAGDCNVYDAMARNLDKFIYANPDFLVIFAGGNEGKLSDTGSVESPATSKNNIAVGAAMSSQAAWKASVAYINWDERTNSIRKKNNFPSDWSCCTSNFVNYCCQVYYDTINKGQMLLQQISTGNPADFTARGPTADGRYKPQLMAPGEPVTSAAADGNLKSDQCGGASLRSDIGTSMATPIVSGSAAMVYQYLKEGFYPSGTPMAKDSIPNPSAALIIAILTVGAQKMNGYVNPHNQALAWFKMEQIPSIYQGFGRIQLDQSLKMRDSGFNMYINDQQQIAKQGVGGGVAFCVTRQDFSAGAGFKVALVWTDPMGEVNAPHVLVNNLDLLVGVSVSDVIAGNFVSKRDVFNNVEIAQYTFGTSASAVSVVVRGQSLALGPQKCAVAIVGQFSSVTLGGSCGTLQDVAITHFPEETMGDVEAEKPNKLPLGAIIAIVIGSVVLCCICGCVLFWWLATELFHEMFDKAHHHTKTKCCCCCPDKKEKEPIGPEDVPLNEKSYRNSWNGASEPPKAPA